MTTSTAATTVIDGHTTLAQRWYSLQVAHDRISARIEKQLQPAHGISLREFSLLEVLNRQHDGEGGHLQMKEVAAAVALSQSATTRLVARLEDRGLLTRYICSTDRRGIYTDVTAAGRELLEAARPLNDAALEEVLAELGEDPEFADLVGVLRG
jgi:DNA-binding MarR family transcriptional regulator